MKRGIAIVDFIVFRSTRDMQPRLILDIKWWDGIRHNNMHIWFAHIDFNLIDYIHLKRSLEIGEWYAT